MTKNNCWIIGIFVLVVSMIGISGCTSSAGNQTFSDNSISFIYPSNMKNTTSSGNIISGAQGWNDVAFLSNGNVYILVAKNPTLTDPSATRDVTGVSVVQNSGKLLSTTDETNPNGVKVYRNIDTLSDPSTNTLLRYYNMFFEDTEGVVYEISVYGDDSKNSQILETANMVFNSLKTI